jgi:hypothetical protein
LFGWLTAYYTQGEPLRQAQIHAYISFAVFVLAIVGLVVHGCWCWLSRRRVG